MAGLFSQGKTGRLNGVKGRNVTMVSHELFGNTDNVADAFTTLKYLVVLGYAQRTFTISVKNTEASSEKEAIRIATRRARRAFSDLGDLLSAECRVDTPQARNELGLLSEEERKPEVLPKWHNAA